MIYVIGMFLFTYPSELKFTTMTKTLKVVVVEDNPYFNKMLTKYLENLSKRPDYEELNFNIQSFQSASECINKLDPDTDIVLLDYYLDGEEDQSNGFQVMRKINETCRHCKVVVLSEQGSLAVVAELFKLGAYDYIEKNNGNRVWAVVQKIIAEKLNEPGFFGKIFHKTG